MGSSSVSPNLPRLALRIGITGHVSSGLPDDHSHIREQVVDILSRIKTIAGQITCQEGAGYENTIPLLQLISPLADGADQLVALQASMLGYYLHVPLPYSRDEYRKELEAQDDFDALLELAEKTGSVMELDGVPGSEEAYERVGRAVYRNADILLAIWDPEAGAKRGGTAQIANEAFESGLPILWIDPRIEQPWCFADIKNRNPERGPGGEYLEQFLEMLLDAPPSFGNKEAGKALETYAHNETKRRWCGLGAFRMAISLFSLRWPFGNPLLPRLDFSKDNWQKAFDMPKVLANNSQEKVVYHYKWADHLANKYANLYRDSFTYVYSLAPLAIAVSIMADEVKDPSFLGLIEVFSLLIALGVFLYAYRKKFHERWMDYRLLAERLRELTFLLPINRVPQMTQFLDKAELSNNRVAWVDWYYRAIVREAGLYKASMTDAYLKGYKDWLSTQIQSQIGHHQHNYRKMSRIHLVLTITKVTVFILAILLAFTHVFKENLEAWLNSLPETIQENLPFWSIMLPVLAASLHAFASQGEIEHLSDRSKKQYRELEYQLGLLKDQLPINSQDLGDSAEKLAGIMSGELTDWHIVYVNKGVPLP